jgi:type II secretory pathway pseudopilin PulG
MMLGATIQHREPAAGMTLIEATVVMAIVSGLMVAAVACMSAAARARQVQACYGRGYVLGQQLLEEVAGARYVEPVDTPTFGRENGETATSRTNYDDVDDYAGWSSTTHKDRAGNTLPGLTGWNEQIAVAWADPNNPAADSNTDQGLKRVTVTITDPRGRPMTLSMLRGRKSVFDTDPNQAGDHIRWIGVVAQVGSDSATAVSASTALYNRPVEP